LDGSIGSTGFSPPAVWLALKEVRRFKLAGILFFGIGAPSVNDLQVENSMTAQA
jgi:hypothetical protein